MAMLFIVILPMQEHSNIHHHRLLKPTIGFWPTWPSNGGDPVRMLSFPIADTQFVRDLYSGFKQVEVQAHRRHCSDPSVPKQVCRS